jgi:hypothetical protein
MGCAKGRPPFTFELFFDRQFLYRIECMQKSDAYFIDISGQTQNSIGGFSHHSGGHFNEPFM